MCLTETRFSSFSILNIFLKETFAWLPFGGGSLKPSATPKAKAIDLLPYVHAMLSQVAKKNHEQMMTQPTAHGSSPLEGSLTSDPVARNQKNVETPTASQVEELKDSRSK